MQHRVEKAGFENSKGRNSAGVSMFKLFKRRKEEEEKEGIRASILNKINCARCGKLLEIVVSMRCGECDTYDVERFKLEEVREVKIGYEYFMGYKRDATLPLCKQCYEEYVEQVNSLKKKLETMGKAYDYEVHSGAITLVFPDADKLLEWLKDNVESISKVREATIFHSYPQELLGLTMYVKTKDKQMIKAFIPYINILKRGDLNECNKGRSTT